MRILRARLLQLEQEKQQAEQAAERKSQVRSADRSERIRTYNFAENRVTDHRIGYTVHRLSEILQGDLDDLIDALVMSERKATLGEGE
jgi:peptide chain release factor 1